MRKMPILHRSSRLVLNLGNDRGNQRDMGTSGIESFV
jgi:hypothetical protein